MFTKTHTLRWAHRWHKKLMWPGLMCLCMFLISALSHPLMVWTGPKADRFFPPQLQLTAEALLATHNITQQLMHKNATRLIKLVPTGLTAEGAVIQVSLQQQDRINREYYAFSGEPLIDFDQQQAIWLSQYYLGEQASGVTHSQLLTSFNEQYPSVNRLLPVWRIEHASGVSVFVHTETSALASINNDWKRSLQRVFQWLHTLSPLKPWKHLQFIVMNLLLGLLIWFVLAGILMVLLHQSRTIKHTSRRWHRRLALVLYVPLLMLSISGVYHLWYSHLANDLSGQQLGQTIQWENVDPSSWPTTKQLAAQINNTPNAPAQPNININHLSIFQQGQHSWLRLSVAQPNPEQSISRQQKYRGQSKEKTSIYWPLSSQASPLNDERLAIALGETYLRAAADQPQSELGQSPILSANKVTHFGQGYDFRNKRLPVWRLSASNSTLFVDPANGIMVEQVGPARAIEGTSFSWLHKWNFLTPLMNRSGRDIVVVITLSLLLLLSLLGAYLGVTQKKKAKRSSRDSGISKEAPIKAAS